jgi:tryptophan 2,3-dioxygenase
MSELPQSLQDELQRITRLRRNAIGPIAETYDTLHGIPFLKEIYRRMRAGRGLDGALHSLPFACLALTILNASTLLQGAADALDEDAGPDIATAAAKLQWCDSILEIATEIVQVAEMLARATGHPVSLGPIPFLDRMRISFSAVGAAVVQSDAVLGESVRSGYLEDAGARLVHLFKNVAWQVSLLESARIAVDAAGADIVRLAQVNAEALALDSDTYNDQFTLLHQVPELISFVSIELIDAAILDVGRRRYARGERNIRIVNALFGCINLCLRPLVALMYPSEYYRFRENLGPTSGSHSKEFGAMLLSKKYEALSKAYRDAAAARPARQNAAFEALEWQVLELRQNLHRWRDTHMMLPRNVLGSEATSLVGTKNATSTVEKMRKKFIRQDVLGEQGRAHDVEADGDRKLAEAGRQAEARLLKITGEAARSTFPEVEARSGPIFGKQAQPGGARRA